ncbi:hypothetical protein N7470_001196 [Penicillium chermesinum]|nr:hypothetical protein N7470_001196 [Penicillium chermesinum]
MAALQVAWQTLKARPVAASAVLAAGAAGAYWCTQNLLPTAQAESLETPKVFGGLKFTTLRLRSSEAINHNTKRLVFEFPDENAQSGLPLTGLKDGGCPFLRPYTPISSLDQTGSIELMVKQYPNGTASTHLHSLQPGDSLSFIATLKAFPWVPNKFSQVYLIAGGAGITPIYQLIQGILNNPNDKTKINLVFGVNTEQDLLLRDELEQFHARFPDRFNYLYTVSRPVENNSSLRKGYVTAELLKEVVKSTGEDTKVFVCGPPSMENALVGTRGTPGILSQLGFTKDQVYKF